MWSSNSLGKMLSMSSPPPPPSAPTPKLEEKLDICAHYLVILVKYIHSISCFFLSLPFLSTNPHTIDSLELYFSLPLAPSVSILFLWYDSIYPLKLLPSPPPPSQFLLYSILADLLSKLLSLSQFVIFYLHKSLLPCHSLTYTFTELTNHIPLSQNTHLRTSSQSPKPHFP